MPQTGNGKMLARMEEVRAQVAERDELIEVIAIALLTRKNVFILGDTGQAKSYVVNLFRAGITGARQFERLMSKQTDEEALFGRLDLASLVPGGVPGEVLERDLAYHQGTVWVYPLGAYYLARLKVNGDSEETKEEVKVQLEVLESALREGCIGQLPEIYDGENPVSSKGCFAQAWSVGEILRVYERLEKVSE